MSIHLAPPLPGDLSDLSLFRFFQECACCPRFLKHTPSVTIYNLCVGEEGADKFISIKASFFIAVNAHLLPHVMELTFWGREEKKKLDIFLFHLISLLLCPASCSIYMRWAACSCPFPVCPFRILGWDG